MKTDDPYLDEAYARGFITSAQHKMWRDLYHLRKPLKGHEAEYAQISAARQLAGVVLAAGSEPR